MPHPDQRFFLLAVTHAHIAAINERDSFCTLPMKTSAFSHVNAATIVLWAIYVKELRLECARSCVSHGISQWDLDRVLCE